MGSPMRMPASSTSGPPDHDGRSNVTSSSGALQNATVSSHMTSHGPLATSSAASSTSKSSTSSNNSTSFSSVHPIGFSPVAPSRPGVNHPIEKLCGGSTPPPQLQRPPGHPSQSHDLAAHHPYGVPSSSSSLAASSPIVPALIAT